MSDEQKPPIMRDKVLAPFSRDHYTALKQARNLREAPDNDVDACGRIALAFLNEWDREISDHFDDEERLLLHLMNEDDRVRTLDEHKQVRDLVGELSPIRDGQSPSPSTMHELGQLLDSHVRWEERELFNRLLGTLNQEQREHLGIQTAEIDPARGRRPRS